MDIHKRIKSLRVQRLMTQAQFARLLHVSTVTVQCWENGSKNPSMNAIIALSQKLNVTTDFLLGVTQDSASGTIPLSRDEVSLLERYRSLDIFGKKAVNTLCSVETSRVHLTTEEQKPYRYIPKYTTPSAAGKSVPLDGDDFEMILADDSVPRSADFAVRIQGDSMAPYIHDGDTVYVERDCKLSIGDIGIFCVDGAMYCKQYHVDDEGNLTLVSANPRLRNTNVHVSADSGISVTCCGKVLLEEKVGFPSYFCGMLG